MISMQMISPAITQIVRAIEPLLMSVFSYCILSESSSFTQLLSILPMMTGIVFIAAGKGDLSSLEYNNFLQAQCAPGFF